MKYERKDIIAKLLSYRCLESKKQLLEYEMEHYIEKISGEDIIEAGSFKSGVGEIRLSGSPSDVVAGLAVAYEEKAAKMNAHDKQEILDAYRQVEEELNRLTYYISLLDKNLSDVIKVHYIEVCSLKDTAKQLDISLTTVHRRLRDAVSKLTDMYNFLGR